MRFQLFLKTIIDLFGAVVGLIILAPLLMVVAALVKIDSSGSIFFRQERVGKDGKLFKMWKFRSMVQGAQSMGLGYEVAKNDSRITGVGRFLRRFGIDEFPQLINVILGEMSLVGPRPAPPHQVEKYSNFEKKRLLVKPGMASLAHIKGWNLIPWKERIKLDIWYIENWSLWLDLKILFKTFIIVLLGKGQYGNGIVKDYESKQR